MAISSDRLIEEVLGIMAVIHQRYVHTNYANDRSVYAQDLMEAMGWIVDMRNGKNLEDVIAKTKSPETDKHFGECWSQGVWGIQEASAWKKLMDRL